MCLDQVDQRDVCLLVKGQQEALRVKTRWWFQIFFLNMFIPIYGEMIQFDLRIFFKMGWFNHQLEEFPSGFS